ncbi:MAG: hypothetical protein HQK83_02145 [Fibrobacteria bacterium]|nr:hypothetical protein [Fibrobacteria bacterium]
MEDFKSKDDKFLDLHLENQSLEQEVERKGAIIRKNDEVDPELYNDFLKYVTAFEEWDKQPKRSFESLFPDDYLLPPSECLNDDEITDKLKEIAEVFEQYHVRIDLVAKVPDRLIYDHLATEVIPTDELSAVSEMGVEYVIDGCDGYCPDCFQNAHCEVKEEF